ncbi:signal peptidase II [Candidatus Woesearchaeota archaeon]|nr:signal peptidase II [Candidatus Woesearchaeota archaeon]
MKSLNEILSCRNSNACMFRAIVVAVLALDVVTKMLAKRYKPSGSGFFSINYTTNTGAAFGLFKGGNIILIIVSLIVLAAIIYIMFYYPKKQSGGMMAFSALVFGGALGNLLDRLFYGHVVDFIDFSFWPAFNIADIAITAGVIGLIFIIYRE